MLSELRTEIINLFGIYPNQKLELEAKFGTVRDNSFKNEIPFSYFDRLRSSMTKSSDPIISKTVDETSNGIRKTTFSDGKILWMNKEKKWEHDSLIHGVRLSLNIERTLDEKEIPEDFQYKVLRIKNRWSFLLNNGNYRLDMTEVDQTLIDQSITTNRFEIELELLNIEGLDDFFKTLNTIFKLIYDTEELWTYPERDNLIQYINQLMNGKPNMKTIDTSTIRQARNLRWADLTYGGIVGNSREDYVVYHKVDGVRKLLVCAPSGVWLVYPHLEFNKVSSNVMKPAIGSILFVENIPPENRKINSPSSKYWAVVYDCAAADGSSDISQKRLGIRAEVGQRITNLLKEQFEERLLSVGTLKYKGFNNPEGFFTVCREFLNEQDTLKYGQDGLIFAPANAPVQHHSDKLPLEERILSKHPDSCKWKPPHLLTNDLSLKWTANPDGTKKLDVECVTNVDEPFTLPGGKIPPIDKATLLKNNEDGTIMTFFWNIQKQAFVILGESRRSYPLSIDEVNKRLQFVQDKSIPFDKKKKTVFDFRIYHEPNNRIGLYTSTQRMTPFRGTEEYPFTPDMIKLLPIMGKPIEDYPTGTVIEFSYEDGFIIPIRIRHDKSLPNRLDIAQDNWIQVRNPIREKALLGETFDFLNKYINRTSDSMIETLSGNESVLIVQKDSLSDKVSKDGVEYLNTNGDSTLKDIPSNKFTCIFFNQCLEDIWSNQVLKDVERILPINGLLVNLGLDGDCIRHLFVPEIRGPITDKITIGPSEIEYHSDSIIIHNKDKDSKEGKYSQSTQKRLISLFPLLQTFNLEKAFRLDDEPFLHLAEKLMGELYSGIFLRRSSTEHKMEIKDVQPIDLPIRILTTNIPPEGVKVEELTRKSPEEKAAILNVAEHTLHMLPVIIPYSRGRRSIPRGVVAAGDDTFEYVRCSWFNTNKVVRIATIGDGSCFFHAVLKAYYPEYQENNEAAFRIDLILHLRRDLAAALNNEDSTNPGSSYYETTGNGIFVELAEQQRLNKELIRQMGVDFSLEGLQRLINSNEDVGDEVYQYVSNMIGVDVYVLRGTAEDLHPHLNTSRAGENKRSVVIVGNKYHYEVVGIETDQGFQTMFPSNHAFLNSLRQKFTDVGGYR